MIFDHEAFLAAELGALLSIETARTLSVWARFVDRYAARSARTTRAGLPGVDVAGTLTVTMETGLPARLRLECRYPYRTIVEYPVVGPVAFNGSDPDAPDEALEFPAPAWLTSALIVGTLPTHPCGAGCGAMAAFDDELCPDCGKRRCR